MRYSLIDRVKHGTFAAFIVLNLVAYLRVKDCVHKQTRVESQSIQNTPNERYQKEKKFEHVPMPGLPYLPSTLA